MERLCIAALMAALLSIGLLAGCSGSSKQTNAASAKNDPKKKIEIVCATFPAYDWAKQVIGDRMDACNITYLMGSGVDLHSYQPSVEDIAAISNADLFVYVGGESDEWAKDASESAGSSKLHAMSMLEAVGDAVVEEEFVEGMEAEHEHEHDGEHHEGEEDESHEHEGEEGPEYDEHVWLSLRNAKIVTDAIAGELSDIDPDNAEIYETNAKAYRAKLDELDERYTAAVRAGSKDTVVFADRFPFRYLVDDYGLKYYAAFAGCSAETEASFETVAFLASKIDELALTNVLVIENSDQKIARTVIDNTKSRNQKILVMDSLQSATESDVKAGKTYLAAMEDNLSVLSAALA